eukprot:10034892-Lingulodinium_polyedra.AAC.1
MRKRHSLSPPLPNTLYQERAYELNTEDTGPASSKSINGKCRRSCSGDRPCSQGCRWRKEAQAGRSKNFSQ